MTQGHRTTFGYQVTDQERLLTATRAIEIDTPPWEGEQTSDLAALVEDLTHDIWEGWEVELAAERVLTPTAHWNCVSLTHSLTPLPREGEYLLVVTGVYRRTIPHFGG